MRVLFAVAELAPFIKVGGLADAASGLVRALTELDVSVEVAIPAYRDLPIEQTEALRLRVPTWAAPATASIGRLGRFGSVAVIYTSGIDRLHPYLDETGSGWPDNDRRFLGFSAAVASLAERRAPDLVHLNDWHTGAVLGFASRPPASVLSIHNLAYQGVADGRWLRRLARRPEAYEWYGQINPISGAIALADRVVAVSPTYAAEITTERGGFGLHEALQARGGRLVGILNGLDTEVWDPGRDPHLPSPFKAEEPEGKRRARRALLERLGWQVDRLPVIGMVTRMVDQKGVDLALECVKSLPGLGARMILLGAGDPDLVEKARRAARRLPGSFAFAEGYDEPLAHLIFGGSDLYLMPSRFEPCGLAQMQAMAYGAIPVVTDVGGLHDTVLDADADPGGSGFVAAEPTVGAVRDALERALRAWRSTTRRADLRRRNMTRVWSWEGPAARYLDLYRQILSEARR